MVKKKANEKKEIGVVGELSDVKCPLCGRFYSKKEAAIKTIAKEDQEDGLKTVNMCIRCLWTAPDIAKHIDPVKKKSWLQWITDYDFTYDKALERKMNKKLKPLPFFFGRKT